MSRLSVEPFRFRLFQVAHDRSSMRVNTDAVLLGAWCPLPGEGLMPVRPEGKEPLSVLEVGTGSGVIALMLAQRCREAQITAIDIDGPSIVQAEENFRLSPWADRLSARHISLQDYAGKLTSLTSLTSPTSPTSFARWNPFHLIISNPPYFRNALRNPDPRRSDARHTDALSFDDLCRCSSLLLADDGLLALVLPADAENDILASAAAYGLSPVRLTRVQTREKRPPKRILMALKKQTPENGEQAPQTDRLILLNPDASRSEAYQQLCAEFYL